MVLRVLLIGATGVFGTRIAARLAHDARFELIVAGRTRSALEHLRNRLATCGFCTQVAMQVEWWLSFVVAMSRQNLST